MHIDKWRETLDFIREKFEVESEETIESEEHGGTKTEYMVFEGPLGKMKMEFIIKPKIIDKHVNYSSRIGSDVKVDYTYSESEKTTQLLIYRWSEADNGWIPVEADSFSI